MTNCFDACSLRNEDPATVGCFFFSSQLQFGESEGESKDFSLEDDILFTE